MRAKSDFTGEQAIFPDLARDEILLRNGDFLAFCIAGKGDDLHAVAQRSRDGLQRVRRGDEHDLGEVESDLKVMVAEL